MKRIYSTARWRRLRAAKLQASPLCEYCPPWKAAPATCVDHRQAIADGGDPWDWENLASSCHGCHSKKTARTDGAFGNRKGKAGLGGCGADGLPLDAGHYWNR